MRDGSGACERNEASRDYLSATHGYVNEYVRFADAKAGAILAVVTVAATVVGACGPLLAWASKTTHVLRFVAFGAFVFAGISAFLAAWHSLSVVAPHVLSRAPNLRAFPDIASLHPTAYVRRVLVLDAETIDVHLAYHIHEMAELAMKKYSNVSKAVSALRILVLSSLVIAVCFVVVFHSGLLPHLASDCQQ